MVERARLRFRRHLALCALLALASELNHSLEHQLAHLANLYTGQPSGGAGTAAAHRRTRAWAPPTRFRLASATQMGAAGAPSEINQVSGPADAIYQYDTQDDLNPMARLLGEFQRHLPVINLNWSLASAHAFPQGQLDASIDDYYSERFPANMTVEELQLMSVKAAARTAPIPLHTSFGYATRELLRLGSLPVQNDQLCALQLAHLARRLEAALEQALKQQGALEPAAGSQPLPIASPVDNFEARQIYRALDLQLMRYLDAFGRAPSDLLRGNVNWYGSYLSCTSTRLRAQTGAGSGRGAAALEQQAGGALKFRYCLAALQSANWRQWAAADERRDYFIRLGVCLPEACDSSALERRENALAIERLAKFNLAKPFSSDHYKLNKLYCLPDARSPLRQIPLLGKLFLLAALGWLALVAAATTIQLTVDKFYTKTVESIRRARNQKLLELLGHREPPPGEDAGEAAVAAAAASSEDEGANEFAERDILNVRLNWIKLNMFLQERARALLPGVDLIECLSLYANWLKYTQRAKLAIVALHERERAQSERRALNERLFRGGAAAGDLQPGAPQAPQLIEVGGSAARGADPPTAGQLAASGRRRRRRVDTSSLNALKVIALLWIIAGHCIFYLGSALANGAHLTLYLPTLALFALANGAIYITELFFIITGCLTSYLAFKHNTRLLPAGGAAGIELSERPPKPAGSSTSKLHRLSGATQATLETSASAAISATQQPPPAANYALGAQFFSAPFWSLAALNRYLRILPTYLAVFAFVKLVSVYAGGHGQLWDYAVAADSVRRSCALESWWPVLTLTSNFVDIYRHCIVGGWYLSVDMQFALLAIPLLLLLARAQRHWLGEPAAARKLNGGATTGNDDSLVQLRKLTASGRERAASIAAGKLEIGEPGNQAGAGKQEARVAVARFGKRVWLAWAAVLALALASGLASAIYAVLFSRVDLSYLVKFSPHAIAILSQNIDMYTNTLFRFRAFASGLLLGHALYLYEFRLIDLPKPVQQHGSKLTVGLFALGAGLMLLPVLYPLGKIRLSHDMTVVCTVLTAAGIDLFASLLIFLLCIGKAPKAVLFLLNSPFWSLLSSLSLSAFLVHAELIVLLTSQLDPPPATSYSLLFFVFSATILLTYALALALYLAFELPVCRLVGATMRSLIALDKNPKGRGSPPPPPTTTMAPPFVAS